MPTLVHRIRQQAIDDPARPALFGPVRDEWRQLACGIWWASIRQVAGGLLVASEFRLERGDPVLVWSGARPEWAVVWPALCLAGAEPILLGPEASDGDLLGALTDPRVRLAAISGRDRLERILRLREEGAVELDAVITLDRTELRAPRLVDLETLLERGGPHRQAVLDRLGQREPGERAARIAEGHPITHGELLAGQSLASTDGRLLMRASPATASALAAVAGTIEAGGELWLGELVGDLAADLPRVRPHSLVLDEQGWKAVLRQLEHLADSTEGVRGQLVRLSVGTGGAAGPAGALARSALQPLLLAAGLDRAQFWSERPLESDLLGSLARLGVDVQVLADPVEPFSIAPAPSPA